MSFFNQQSLRECAAAASQLAAALGGWTAARRVASAALKLTPTTVVGPCCAQASRCHSDFTHVHTHLPRPRPSPTHLPQRSYGKEHTHSCALLLLPPPALLQAVSSLRQLVSELKDLASHLPPPNASTEAAAATAATIANAAAPLDRKWAEMQEQASLTARPPPLPSPSKGLLALTPPLGRELAFLFKKGLHCCGGERASKEGCLCFLAIPLPFILVCLLGSSFAFEQALHLAPLPACSTWGVGSGLASLPVLGQLACSHTPGRLCSCPS